MRRIVVAALVAAALVMVATPASAKGAQDAVLRGPGLGDAPATLDPQQAMTLAIAANVYSAVEHDGPNRAAVVLARKPAGDLGPRYIVTFHLFIDGADGTAAIRQRLYPFAEGGPVSYMPGGQKWCDSCGRTVAGWFEMKAGAVGLLRELGVSIPNDVDRAGWSTARDDAQRLSISYPPSWHAAPSTLTPVLADPIVPLAVGTASMVPQRLGECDIVPQHAVEAVGPTDALVLVYLYQGMASGSSTLTRPHSFGPDLPWRTGPVQCTNGNPNVSVRTLSFTDNAARLSVMVVVGKDATPQRTAEVYAVLDSLRVE